MVIIVQKPAYKIYVILNQDNSFRWFWLLIGADFFLLTRSIQNVDLYFISEKFKATLLYQPRETKSHFFHYFQVKTNWVIPSMTELQLVVDQ